MLSQEADAKKGASKTAKSLNFGKGTPIRGLGRRDGEQLDLVIEMEGKRHRTWSSCGQGGKMYIDQGKFVSDGSEGTWFNTCER